MGPAVWAATPADVFRETPQHRLQALPSPASITTCSSSASPTHDFGLTPAGTRTPPSQTPPGLLSDDSAPVPSAPGDVDTYLMTASTPPMVGTPQPDLNVIVGGALAPLHTEPPHIPERKPGPGFRLPSFAELGIAAPHPDRYGRSDVDGQSRDRSIEWMPEPLGSACDDVELLHAFNRLGGISSISDNVPGRDQESSMTGGRAVHSPVHHFVSTLTPPAETGEMDWQAMAPMSTPSLNPPSHDRGNIVHHTSPVQALGEQPNIGLEDDADAPLSTSSNWVDGAVNRLLDSTRFLEAPNNSIRILSHALPSPSPTGHIYSTVVSALHNSTPISPMTWINVFHAIPGRFSSVDIPTSPPATPGPPIGGEDYFTQKVFDSAVQISDYQDDLSSLPRSPRPVVPPSSIDVSVVERYIPPTNPNEFAHMFEENGPSILVDRLVELSPNNGSLIFIYPTKTGARTFMEQYLCPILDPSLRSMAVSHGLPMQFCKMLGNMSAVERMYEHDVLERKTNILCTTLTQRSKSLQRFHGRQATFSLDYAEKREVKPSRDAWAKDWWTKQEKPHVRDVLTRFAHEAQKRSSNKDVDRPTSPAELIQHLLDEVCKKAYQPGQEPSKGIEVSVFVIKRSA